MHNLLRMLRNLLYPNRCIFCDAQLTGTDSVLCCASCETKLTQVGYSHTHMDMLSVSWSIYDDVVRKAIIRFKFHHRPQYAYTFAYLMAKALVNLDGFDAVTWAPTSRLRKWKRGYDQSEELAKELSKRLGLPMVKGLYKVKHTKKQSGLSAADRKKNVQGKYRANENTIYGRNLLVVDDVYTTGATMSACMETLLVAGAASCIGVTIARTQNSRNKAYKK